MTYLFDPANWEWLVTGNNLRFILEGFLVNLEIAVIAMAFSLACADGAFAVARPIVGGFAMIEPHHTLGEAEVIVDSTEWGHVAKSGALGPAVVPNLTAYADRVTARLEAVAPGFTSSVMGRQVIGPDLMQSEYGLVGGNIFHGELTPGQMFHCRPAAGYADLRTPVRGLYQAGSATHGGGGVTGIPGRNVVRQILRDRRRWPRR